MATKKAPLKIQNVKTKPRKKKATAAEDKLKKKADDALRKQKVKAAREIAAIKTLMKKLDDRIAQVGLHIPAPIIGIPVWPDFRERHKEFRAEYTKAFKAIEKGLK